MTEDPIVLASGLIKHFGRQQAVDGINLRVEKGDIYGFLGPNGSGKSTTIRMLLGLIKPDKGDIRLFGKSLATDRKFILGKVGALIERPDFYHYLSAFKNLALLASYSGVRADSHLIMEKLDIVGLASRAHSKVGTFSHGMKQRLGIAQTLIHEPELIILDEPVNGLDPQGIKDIRELILLLNGCFGKTLIISSHILREMELIANRMVVINKGKVVVEGEVKVLLSSGRQKLILVVDEAARALQLLNSAFPEVVFETNRLNEIHADVEAMTIPAINSTLVNHGIGVRQLQSLNSLEDYFLQIT
ncbi:MAG: ATP-binding cassette domain-containing protein [Bacteroidetes bacterium]|nr:ATP-binding cassette domain-containing protein [Bacteroidota bacterium]